MVVNNRNEHLPVSRAMQAHNALKDYEAAYKAFTKGLELEPDNKIFKNLQTKALEQVEVSLHLIRRLIE